MDALPGQDTIKYVLGLQEAVVLGMADAYAQASGHASIVNLHAAPGLGNALGMLYNAKRSGSPIVVTAGQHDQSFTLTEPVLWDDLPTIARPFVKWSGEVTRTADLPRALHRAFKIAMSPPRGPVFLSVPGDVLTESAALDLGHPTRIAPGMRADLDAIEKAAEYLLRAERPILIAGDAISQSDALAEMVELAELVAAPVYLEGAQNTATYPSTHSLFAGTLGRLAKALRSALDKHDVLFSVGGDLFTLSLPPEVEPVPAELTVLHLDNDPWELGKNFSTDVAMLGDPKATLPDIVAAISRLMTAEDRKRIEDRRKVVEAEILKARQKYNEPEQAAQGRRMSSAALVKVIAANLPADVIVVEELLSSRGKIRELLPSLDHQSFFSMRGGGIGWGMPAGVGVKLAQPQRPVVALVGDGSALYTCQALWTAANQGLNGLVYIIFNNSSYRILKQRQKDMRGNAAQTGIFTAMELVNPSIDYVSLANSFGVDARRIEDIGEVVPAIESSLAAKGPVLLEVMVDRSI